jgi:hypothetical protein
MAEISNLKVPKSITNPEVDRKYALDVSEPYSFLNFIKNIDNVVTPETSQAFYMEYLKAWNSIKNLKGSDSQQIIVDRYKEFIKDISLNFTNENEKRFLSQINFDDPLDLDVAIPFYSKKLIEITNFYNKKREELKYQVLKKKMVGTPSLLKSELRTNIINYLESLQEGSYIFDIESIKQELDVEVEELYDSYPSYFNQAPNDKIYDNKDLDYGLNIFLKNNEDLISEVFSDFTTTQIELKELNDLFDNKRKLTQKYIGNDFYYLSTGSTVTDYVSGLLFEANKPSANFFNIDNPTTASSDKKILETPNEIGFFRPHKTSIINIDGELTTFSINFDNLEPNTVYLFPDPTIRGNNGDVLTFVNNDDYVRRNFTSGKSKNIPISKKNDTKYYGYVSKIEPNDKKYLDDIFSSGYVQDSKKDIYNNLFGLFINDGSFTKTINVDQTVSNYNLIINGHAFFDRLYSEGYNYNYSTFDDTTYNTTTRSGLSTYTNGFTEINGYYQIYGGNFSNDEFYYDPEYFPAFQTFDGIFFTNNGTLYPDTVSSDLSAYQVGGQYYYSRLIEGGVNRLNPPQRALLDPLYPSLTANMTMNVLPNGLSSFEIDGAFFNSNYEVEVTSLPVSYYDNTVFNTSVYVLSSTPTKNLYERYPSKGGIYVRNSYTMEVSRIEDELTYLSNILPLSTYNECISGVKHFDLHNDLVIIQTENNLIFTKLNYQNGVFSIPTEQTMIFNYNKNSYNKITNTYKKDDFIYFVVMEQGAPSSVGNIKVIPSVYEYSISQHRITKYTVSDIPDIQIENINFNRMDEPKLSYNSRKNIFNISYLLKDINNNFSIIEIEYKSNPFKMLKLNQYDQK